MICPFGRQRPAATLRQHCPQMTRRRCNLGQAYMDTIIQMGLSKRISHISTHLRKISTYKQPVKYIPRQANLKFSTSLSKWCSQDSTVAPLFTALGLPIPSIPTRRVPLPPTPPPITPDSLGISKIARQITSLAALIWRCGPG